MLAQDQGGEIEKGLPCATVAQPGAGISAHQVVLREARAQQRQGEPPCALKCVRIAGQQLRAKPSVNWQSTIASCNRARWRDSCRHRPAGNRRQRLRKLVAGVEAQEPRETMIGHPGCRFQKVSHGIQRRADDQGGDRVAHGRDFRARRAADGQRRALGFDQMTVERIGDVRNDDWTQSEGFSRCSRPSRKTACSRSATCCAAPSAISSASTTWSVVRRSCAACSTRPGWSPKGTPRCRFAAKRAPARN